MKKTLILTMLALGFASSSVQADELILTRGAQAKAGVSQVYSLDFVTSGDAVAFQFNIALPKGVDASHVDLTNCVSELPKSHTGQCNVANGQIIGLVFNDTNEAFSAGVVSVGKIAISVGQRRSLGKDLKVSQFLVSDSKAQPISARAEIVE